MTGTDIALATLSLCVNERCYAFADGDVLAPGYSEVCIGPFACSGAPDAKSFSLADPIEPIAEVAVLSAGPLGSVPPERVLAYVRIGEASDELEAAAVAAGRWPVAFRRGRPWSVLRRPGANKDRPRSAPTGWTIA